MFALALVDKRHADVSDNQQQQGKRQRAVPQAEQGSRKAAARLAEYYQFAAHGLPDLPEDEREAKAEYWQKRAQEIQAK